MCVKGVLSKDWIEGPITAYKIVEKQYGEYFGVFSKARFTNIAYPSLAETVAQPRHTPGPEWRVYGFNSYEKLEDAKDMLQHLSSPARPWNYGDLRVVEVMIEEIFLKGVDGTTIESGASVWVSRGMKIVKEVS